MSIITRSAPVFFALILLASGGMALGQPAAAADFDQKAYDIGFEAYLYPLVIMNVTRRQMTNVEAGKVPFRGPMNTFVHVRKFPPAEFRNVVRPNFDTLYSAAFLDLTRWCRI